jgi:predicted CoA-binding protein
VAKFSASSVHSSTNLIATENCTHDYEDEAYKVNKLLQEMEYHVSGTAHVQQLHDKMQFCVQ